ncbi:hypothetical protein GCM10009609_00660 [Pseudonocardia aurantiaca]
MESSPSEASSLPPVIRERAPQNWGVRIVIRGVTNPARIANLRLLRDTQWTKDGGSECVQP